MDNAMNLCGKEIMGYTLTSHLREECFGDSFVAKAQNGAIPDRAVVHRVCVPTEVQYTSILAKCGNDADAANAYIAKNIEVIRTKLSQLKQISSPDQYSLAPIYDYAIEKSESSYSYDIFVSTKQMLPLARFAEVNGLTVRDGVQFGMQLLGAMDIAHNAGLYHTKLDTDCIYIDESGRCKLFGLVLAQAVTDFGADHSSDAELLKRADTVGAACVMYKLFNNFSFPADSSSPLMPNYRAALLSGTQYSSIIPPAKSNAALADVILRAFSGSASAYANCEEFAAALGSAIQSVGEQVMSGVIIGNPDGAAPATCSSAAPSPKQDYDNTNSYFKSSPVPAKTNPPKSNKPMIIAIAVVSAVLVISIIAFLLWQFVFSDRDNNETPVNPSAPIVEIDGSSLTISEGETTELVFTAKNISEDELSIESSDESVVTVDGAYITAVGEGTAVVTITDTDGNELDSIKITVEAAPNVDKIDVAYIESMLAGGTSGSQYGMYVIDVAEGREYEFSTSNDVLGSSALVSIPLLYTFGKQVDDGFITEDSRITFEHTYKNGRGIYKEDSDGKQLPISQIVSAMLSYSDNNCINTLMNYFGTDEIASTMRANGMTGTSVLRNLANNPPDNVENKISARDAGQMLYEIIKDDMFPGKAFLDTHFRISDKYGNAGMGSSIIPTGATFLNHNAKTTTKYNEIAYVQSGDAEFIIVFISNGGNPDSNVELAEQIAAYVYDCFTSN